jgi:anti-sigma B factor antagonist
VSDLLNIAVYRTESSAYLVPSGRIIAESSTELKRVGESHFSQRIDEYILNLRNVDFIDSAGLGVLVGLKVQCAKEKVQFLLLEPSRPMEQIFAVARLDSIFNIVRGAEAERIRARIEVEEYAVRFRGEADPQNQTLERESPSTSEEHAAMTVEQTSEAQVTELCREAIEKVRQAEYGRAVALYEKALQLDPDCLSALNNLAIVYEKKPAWMRKAIETWDKVRELSERLGDQKHLSRAQRRLDRLRTHFSEGD